MLAMVLYPDVQEKARREIDSVVGLGRLPDFNDRGSLPYIDAIVKEVLRYVTFTDNTLYLSTKVVVSLDFRWNPVAPLGKYTFSSATFDRCRNHISLTLRNL